MVLAYVDSVCPEIWTSVTEVPLSPGSLLSWRTIIAPGFSSQFKNLS